MAHQLVDQLLKKMADYHADEFIRLAFPRSNFEVISTKLEKELIIRTTIVDSVIKIAIKDEKHLVYKEDIDILEGLEQVPYLEKKLKLKDQKECRREWKRECNKE